MSKFILKKKKKDICNVTLELKKTEISNEAHVFSQTVFLVNQNFKIFLPRKLTNYLLDDETFRSTKTFQTTKHNTSFSSVRNDIKLYEPFESRIILLVYTLVFQSTSAKKNLWCFSDWINICVHSIRLLHCRQIPVENQL